MSKTETTKARRRSMDDNEDKEISGIKHSEHLTMVDRLRSKLHEKIDRSDSGAVIYPRREYLQNQANARKAQAEEERKRSGK